MNKKDFVQAIEYISPGELAENWDNCGFQVDAGASEVNRVLVALEVTNQVIDEAIEKGADLILTHHPLIFGGVNKIDAHEVIGGYISKLIKNDISVYSCHTNFDKAEKGNNEYIGRILDLEGVRAFDNDNGFCRKGETPFETTFAEAIHMVSEAFQIDEKYFNTVGDKTRVINSIGWCSGSGSEFIRDAIREGCDMFITGDVKYHDAIYAKESQICVLDAGHYGSERIFIENMTEILRFYLKNEEIEILESIIDINPFM